MRTTTNEGLPYPLGTDPALLPLEAQAFLLAQDAKFPAWDTGFQPISKAPGFSARCTVDGSAISSAGISSVTWDTIDYCQGLNGYGCGLSAGAVTWTQPTNDGPSFWIFGCSLYVATVSGTVNANNLIQVSLTISDIDPNSATNQTITNNLQGKSECIADTSGGSQAIQVATLAWFRNANAGQCTVQFTHRDAGNPGPVTKKYQAGSHFWGFRVGSA